LLRLHVIKYVLTKEGFVFQTKILKVFGRLFVK